jgi:hypothetical protein
MAQQRTGRRRGRGQALVETAMVLPILIVIIMGTIDGGYYIFNWSVVQFAARRGAEQAALLPPREVRNSYDPSYVSTDPCYRLIIQRLRSNGSFTAATDIEETEVQVRFWVERPSGSALDPSTNFVRAGDASGSAAQPDRKVLNIIEVSVVNHRLNPLTPVGETVFGQLAFSASSRRTIVSTEISGGLANNPDLLKCRDS